MAQPEIPAFEDWETTGNTPYTQSSRMYGRTRKQEFLHRQMIQGGTRNILVSPLCIQRPTKPILKTKVQGTHHIDRDLKLINKDTPTGLLTVSLHHEDMQILTENKGVMLWHQEAPTGQLLGLLRQCSQTTNQSRIIDRLRRRLQREGILQRGIASIHLEGAG
uniref:Uncharacterized protein n=2 Tax=Zea mays TaxID=4577 RepID=B8A2J5_MAIZE|nr:unknown [Zea mays]|eukprot:NP_001146617.1 Nitrate-induced NOI protein [Zea mays]